MGDWVEKGGLFGMLTDEDEVEAPPPPPVAPPPLTVEDPSVRQSAMQRKAKLQQASRAKARKNINYKDTLSKGDRVG